MPSWSGPGCARSKASGLARTWAATSSQRATHAWVEESLFRMVARLFSPSQARSGRWRTIEHEAAVALEAVDLCSPGRRERVGAERVRGAGHLLADRVEAGEHRGGVDVAPLEGEQGDAVLDAGALARRRGVAQAGLAQDLDAARAQLAAGRAQAGQLEAQLGEGGDASRQVLGLLGGAQVAPLLVQPGVVGDLVAGRGDRAQRPGVELGVDALGEEGRGQIALGQLLQQRRQSRGGARCLVDPEVVEAEAERAAGAARPGGTPASVLEQRRAPALRFALRLLARPAEVMAGRGEQDREAEQAGEGEAARAARRLGREAERAGDAPGPEHGVVGGELRRRSGPRLRRASAGRRAATRARP